MQMCKKWSFVYNFLQIWDQLQKHVVHKKTAYLFFSAIVKQLWKLKQWYIQESFVFSETTIQGENLQRIKTPKEFMNKYLEIPGTNCNNCNNILFYV